MCTVVEAALEVETLEVLACTVAALVVTATVEVAALDVATLEVLAAEARERAYVRERTKKINNKASERIAK